MSICRYSYTEYHYIAWSPHHWQTMVIGRTGFAAVPEMMSAAEPTRQQQEMPRYVAPAATIYLLFWEEAMEGRREGWEVWEAGERGMEEGGSEGWL